MTTMTEFQFLSSDGHTQLHGMLWEPTDTPVRAVLHPPRLGIVLGEGVLGQGEDTALPVEYDGPGAGRPLIQRQNMVRHSDASFIFEICVVYYK